MPVGLNKKYRGYKDNTRRVHIAKVWIESENNGYVREYGVSRRDSEYECL
jgi:hypothetical protein